MFHSIVGQVIDPVAFQIGSWPVMWYAIIIVVGIVIADFMIRREGLRKGIDEDTVFDFVFWVIIFGFIGARLYYVLFRLDYYLQNPGQIIQIWSGGLAIYGGVIAGIITIYVMCKRRNMNFFTMLDIAAPAVLTAQAIGRWGNFVNQEAHGGPVSREFLESLFLPEFIIEQMNIQGMYYHPTFLYESIWNIIGVSLLLWLRSRPKLLLRGEVAAGYAIWYGFGRMIIEGMRTDSLYLGPLRISQWVSIALVLGGIIFVIYRRHNKEALSIPYYTDDRHTVIKE